MNFKTRTLEELRTRRASISGKFAVVGLDGFVDLIVHPVATRHGQGEAFEPMQTIEEFGRRILGAAGKSTNVELYPVLEKFGGNGPIMATALLAAGLQLKYIGALGAPALHPVFQDMARRAEVVSLCEPSFTTALEFSDGKLMLGLLKSLDEVTYAQIVKVMGEGVLFDCLSRADLVALVNWTMIPNMTAILEELVGRVFPVLPPRERVFFFDLADPEKRSASDLSLVLRAIARFQAFGRVTLGLNLKRPSGCLPCWTWARKRRTRRACARWLGRSARNSILPPWSCTPRNPPPAPRRTTPGGSPVRLPKSRSSPPARAITSTPVLSPGSCWA